MSADTIACLKITLDDVKPAVLRRVEVPFDIRLERLHLTRRAYRLGNFALRLVGVIRAIRADGRNYMFSVEWTPVASKENVNVT